MPDFRVIPSIEQLRQRASALALSALHGREAVVEALREEAGRLRERVAAGDPAPATPEDAADLIERRAAERLRRLTSLRRVINATGVIVHTNLGRAPLAASAVARIAALAAGYTNLEYDLGAGRRGARDVHAERLLCQLTGAEAAVVVNNNAAATLLVLAALCRDRDVLVSRGELVEIGGGFRVPDVMTQSGARLVEVGTTNRTRIGDFALAIGERTGAILRVHPSNFRMEGFTERASLDDLVALGRRFQVPVIEDLGSGMLTEADADGRPPSGALAAEPTVRAVVAAGANVVCFSGDKLLGGPQAGLVVGRRDLIERVRRHPLMRAVRVDKLTYAALEATLAEHLAGRATETVPVLRMATMPLDAIGARADALAARLREGGFSAEVIDGFSTIGGGSAPGSELPTRLVATSLAGVSAAALEARLRQLDPPVIARIHDDRVVLDLRTVAPEDDEVIGRAGMNPDHM